MRDGLAGRGSRRLHHVHDRIHRHAVGGIEHELLSLREIATHVNEPLERVGIERAHEFRDAAPQCHRIGTASRLELLGDLEKIPNDHLIVGSAAFVFLDGACHLGWLRRRQLGIGLLDRECRSREPHP